MLLLATDFYWRFVGLNAQYLQKTKKRYKHVEQIGQQQQYDQL